MVDDEEKMRRIILASHAAEERILAGKVFGELHGITASNVATPAPSLAEIMADMDKALERIAAMPPIPFFGSGKSYPADKAFSFMHEGREYVLAHPDFWAKLPPSPNGIGNPLYQIEIIDLDRSTNAAHRKMAEDALAAVVGEYLG